MRSDLLTALNTIKLFANVDFDRFEYYRKFNSITVDSSSNAPSFHLNTIWMQSMSEFHLYGDWIHICIIFSLFSHYYLFSLWVILLRVKLGFQLFNEFRSKTTRKSIESIVWIHLQQFNGLSVWVNRFKRHRIKIKKKHQQQHIL